MITKMKKFYGGRGGTYLEKDDPINASFSEELLAHRCGFSDAILEGSYIILDTFVMRADPLKLCFS